MRSAAKVAAGGVLYALALPPVGCSALGWVALVPLIAVARTAAPASALWLGMLGGYIAGWSVQWWFAETVRHYFALPMSLGVLATMASVLLVWSLPFGLFAASVTFLHRRATHVPGPLLVAASWAASEFLRTRLIGQPWGLLGYSQYTVLPLIQIAAWTGVYGVSFLLALTAAGLVDSWDALRSAAPLRVVARAASWVAVAPAVWLAGALAMHAAPVEDAPQEVVVVQGNVRPVRHWDRAYGERQLRTHLDLTRRALRSAHPRLIVWPENAVTRYPEQDPLVAARLADVVRQSGADLLFGAPRSAGGHIYNSARLLRAGDRHPRHYDKRLLVPFAESPAVGAPDIAADGSPEAFSAGSGAGLLEGFMPMGVSICHEILHPDLIAASVRAGASVLVNIANDGLADQGYSVAAEQHAAMAVFRAVETRRFLVRAAATGPSIVVDPLGRVAARLPQGTSGTLTVQVGARGGWTPYVAIGDGFAIGCLLLVIAALLPLPVLRRRAAAALAPAPS